MRLDSSTPPWVCTRVPQVPGSVSWARRSLRSVLEASGASRTSICDAELVLGELVANAVEHGCADDDGTIEVGWRLVDDAVQVGVHDSGHVSALTARPAGPDDAQGRGLALVEQLSERWSYVEDDGTRVGAELHLAPAL